MHDALSLVKLWCPEHWHGVTGAVDCHGHRDFSEDGELFCVLLQHNMVLLEHHVPHRVLDDPLDLEPPVIMRFGTRQGSEPLASGRYAPVDKWVTSYY